MKPTLFVAALAGMFFNAALPSDAKAEEYCREYTRSVIVGGVQQNGYGTACLQPDGSWEIQNSDVTLTGGRSYTITQPPQSIYVYDRGRTVFVPSRRITYIYGSPWGYRYHGWNNRRDRHDHWAWNDPRRDWNPGDRRGWDRGHGHDRHDRDGDRHDGRGRH